MIRPRLLESESTNDCVKGEYVLLHNGKEHFWVHVCDLESTEKYYGIIQTKLNENKRYNYGDAISFYKKHIFSVTVLANQTVSNTHEFHQA